MKSAFFLFLMVSTSSQAACLMVRKPIVPKVITCEGPISKIEDGYTRLTGQRVQIKAELGRRSSCYTSYLKYKVSEFKNIKITETIYEEGQLPEDGVSKIKTGVKGKQAKSLSLESFLPSLGMKGLEQKGEDSYLDSYGVVLAYNMNYNKNSYRGVDGNRVVNSKYRQARLECRSEY